MPVDVAQLHYVLSAIASTGKIIETAISLVKQGIRPEYRALKIESDEFAKDLLNRDNPVKTIVLAANIPKAIFEAVAESIDQLHKRIAGVLGNLGMEMPEISKRVDADRQRICQYIVELSKFGEVPESMMTIWNNSKCADQGFKLN